MRARATCYARRMPLLAALLVALLASVSATAGEIETFELASPLVDTSTTGGRLEDDRAVPKVHVLLPNGYKPKRRYPVLWLLHGANGGSDTWIPGFTNALADFEGIVVMPDGGQFGMYTDWWNAGTRGNPAWATYHLKVLRDEIDRRYRIKKSRRWHAIAGISMGGQGTLRYAGMLPGYFGTAVGFSAAVADMQSDIAQIGIGALTGGAGVSYDALWGSPMGAYAEGNNPQALAPNYAHTRMYLTSGDGVNCPGDPKLATYDLDVVTETFINQLQGPFADAVRAQGADVTDVTTCGVHTFGVWDRAIVDALAWGFFEPVEAKPRQWTYRTVAQEGEMWGLDFRFDAPPAEVAQFERDGGTLKATGSGTVRITGTRRCRFEASLPFERKLPPACRRVS